MESLREENLITKFVVVMVVNFKLFLLLLIPKWLRVTQMEPIIIIIYEGVNLTSAMYGENLPDKCPIYKISYLAFLSCHLTEKEEGKRSGTKMKTYKNIDKRKVLTQINNALKRILDFWVFALNFLWSFFIYWSTICFKFCRKLEMILFRWNWGKVKWCQGSFYSLNKW